MARPGGPWYWTARKRWAATINGTRHLAPHKLTTKDKAEAWAWYAELAKEVAAPRPALTVADLHNLYLADCKARAGRGDMNPETVRVASSALTKACSFIIAGSTKFGSLSVVDVRLRHLESIAAQWATRPGAARGTTTSSAYRATATGWVRTAFKWAVRPTGGLEPILQTDPFIGFKPPQATPAKVRICERKDAATWLRWLRSQPRTEAHRGYVLLQHCLMTTGARPSEWTRATWEDVRWEAGRTSTGAGYGTLIRAEWKNSRKNGGKPRRVVILPALLRKLRREYDRLQPAPGDPIFRSSTGKPWTTALLSGATYRQRDAAKAAGYKLPEGEGRVRGYGWRHAVASRLVMGGVDLMTIGDLLGTSASMVQKTYGHLRDDHVAAAAEVLTSGRGGSGRAGGRPGA